MNKLENIFSDIVYKLNPNKFYIMVHMKEFHSYIENVSKILDIGGGSTPYKHIFNFKEYINLEIDNTRYMNIDIFGDITDLPIRDSSIDCVICTEVLEHVKYTDNAFRELSRVLKKGNYLILTTPLIIGMHDSVDYYRFTERALRFLFKKHDFEIILLYKRGGIFSSLYGILLQLPYQIFGPYNYKRNYLKFGSIFLFYLLLFPIMEVCLFLDNFDKNKNFTLGYDVLARKII